MKLLSMCNYCKKEFKYSTVNRRGKYCSNACNADHRLETNIKKAIKEKSFFGVSPKVAKCYAVLLWGHTCKICKGSEWQGELIPLVLDHINGNSDDWLFTNLRLICCNCDAQTPTYKNKNRGNGRHSRRKRYKEGKSY